MIPTRPWPVHTLLFAAYAVLFLFAENVADVAFEEVLPPLVRALLGALVVLLVAGLLLRDLRRGAIVATAIVIAWSAYGHLGGMLAPMEVSRDAQLTLWVVVILIAVVAAVGLRERWVAALTRGLDVVAGVLVAITSFQIARYVLTRPAPAVASAASPEGEAAPGARDSTTSSSTATDRPRGWRASAPSRATSASGLPPVASSSRTPPTRTTDARRCRSRRR